MKKGTKEQMILWERSTVFPPHSPVLISLTHRQTVLVTPTIFKTKQRRSSDVFCASTLPMNVIVFFSSFLGMLLFHDRKIDTYMRVLCCCCWWFFKNFTRYSCATALWTKSYTRQTNDSLIIFILLHDLVSSVI